MKVTGKDEFEVAPGRQQAALDWILQMESAYHEDGLRIREYSGPASDHGFSDMDLSVLGRLDPFTGQIHLFYCEEQNLAARAEELAHYFQYKAQGWIGQTEEQIGADVIDANEREIMQVLQANGFRRKRS
jgi:hypothetical protein